MGFVVFLWWFVGRGGDGKIEGDGVGRGMRERMGLDLKGVKGGDLWAWVRSFPEREKEREGKKGGAKIDWEERRERVRDAFVVSWDAYEQDAWGECSSLFWGRFGLILLG